MSAEAARSKFSRDENDAPVVHRDERLPEIDQALARLEFLDQLAAKVVELRYLGGNSRGPGWLGQLMERYPDHFSCGVRNSVNTAGRHWHAKVMRAADEMHPANSRLRRSPLGDGIDSRHCLSPEGVMRII
jgi:hypothetical protein